MNESTAKLLIALLGLPIGLLTYYFTKLWMEPYFEYEKLRAKISADLFYYANAIEIDMTDTESYLFKRYVERCEAFRHHSADLLALYPLLPNWHRIHHWEAKEYPEKAVRQLLVYSNAGDAEMVRKAAQEISELLKLPMIPS